MSEILENLPALVQDLFLHLPEDLNRQLDVPFCQRRRSLSPSSFVRTLVFGWLDNPNASVEDLAEYATTLGSPISESGLRQRFTDAAVCLLAAILEHALQPLLLGQPSTLSLLQRFQGVHVFDSTNLSLPACLAPVSPGCGNQSATTNAACKLLLGLELTCGGLLQLDLFAGRQPDQGLIPLCQPLPAGALLLRDLGFFSLKDFAHQHEQGVYYLTRAHPQLVVQRGHGQTQSLMAFLRDRGVLLDVDVEVGTKDRLACRLIAWRVPDEVAQRRKTKRLEQHQRKIRRRTKKRHRGRKVGSGKKPSKPKATGPTAEQLEQCEWVVVLTNVPREQLSVAEAEALLRARWQIELLIKLWKGSGCLEGIEAHKPERAWCELLAKLLGQVVTHWVILSSGLVYLESNVTRAARKVKKYAERLGQALGQGEAAVREVLQELQQRVRKSGKRRRGKKRPSTVQRLDGQLPPWFSSPAA
jgi:hypothetical protein